MDKRISELRDRLWKKKAALQKENMPVSITDTDMLLKAGTERPHWSCFFGNERLTKWL